MKFFERKKQSNGYHYYFFFKLIYVGIVSNEHTALISFSLGLSRWLLIFKLVKGTFPVMLLEWVD